MRSFRVVVLLFAALAPTGCQTAGNLIQAPFNMMGRMFQAMGRTVNMADDEGGAAGTRSIEDREARAAAAEVAAGQSLKAEAIVPKIVQR